MGRTISMLVLIAACGSESRRSEVQPEPSLVRGIDLVARDFTTTPEQGSKTTTVWIETSRVGGISLDDPCCGLWYDGGGLDDANVTCAPKGVEECEGDLWMVWPAVAVDPVCGERRRCKPLPQARVVVLGGDAVSAMDLSGNRLPSGPDAAHMAYGRVRVTREGAFVVVELGERRPRVAVDLGARYTIYVKGGAIERVTRDVAGA